MKSIKFENAKSNAFNTLSNEEVKIIGNGWEYVIDLYDHCTLGKNHYNTISKTGETPVNSICLDYVVSTLKGDINEAKALLALIKDSESKLSKIFLDAEDL